MIEKLKNSNYITWFLLVLVGLLMAGISYISTNKTEPITTPSKSFTLCSQGQCILVDNATIDGDCIVGINETSTVVFKACDAKGLQYVIKKN